MIKRGEALSPRLPVVFLGFECRRSVQEPERRGFAVKPIEKYVDGRLELVHVQNAKPVVTPLTEQRTANLHNGTTVCDQAEHALFRAVVGKLQFIVGVRPDILFVTKCLSYKLASPTLAVSTRVKKALR